MKHFEFTLKAWPFFLLVLILGGCTTPPFKPKTDISIVSVSSGSGSDEINPSLTLIDGNFFPYEPAVIQFTLNNGVGVTLKELDISYEAPEGGQLVYQDSNGVIQTGIPPKNSKIQRRFSATVPFTELGQSGSVIAADGVNQGDGTQRTCCLFIRLVTQQAATVLSVDGNFQTVPNLNTDIIANLTIRGIDDNDNPFTREASILVSAIPEQVSGTFDPGCDDTCSIGTKPSGGESGGGDTGGDTGGGTTGGDTSGTSTGGDTSGTTTG